MLAVITTRRKERVSAISRPSQSICKVLHMLKKAWQKLGTVTNSKRYESVANGCKVTDENESMPRSPVVNNSESVSMSLFHFAVFHRITRITITRLV